MNKLRDLKQNFLFNYNIYWLRLNKNIYKYY